MTHQVSCEDVISKLLEYFDRELDADAQRDIEHHLETCRACFTRAEFERRLRARVAEAGEAKAPDSLRRRIRLLIGRY